MTTTKPWFDAVLLSRLDAPAREWFAAVADEIASGIDDGRFASLISLASRHAPRGRLEPDERECEQAAQLLPGWNPERWTTLECVRIALLLTRSDLDGSGVERALDAVFEYADDGESCAMYKSLPHLPDAKRFALRAAEGCRTNIVPVFEAVACDTPFPSTCLDDVAWTNLCIKALFIGAPLWRVFGLDDRLSPELARMALDLVDERRSAAREVQPELWLCIGEHGGERGLNSMTLELASSNTLCQRAAALGLARAGQRTRLEELALAETDESRLMALRCALDGGCDASTFKDMNPR